MRLVRRLLPSTDRSMAPASLTRERGSSWRRRSSPRHRHRGGRRGAGGRLGPGRAGGDRRPVHRLHSKRAGAARAPLALLVLAGAVHKFRLLKVGLSGVLVFVGGKMMLSSVVKLPPLIPWQSSRRCSARLYCVRGSCRSQAREVLVHAGGWLVLGVGVALLVLPVPDPAGDRGPGNPGPPACLGAICGPSHPHQDREMAGPRQAAAAAAKEAGRAAAPDSTGYAHYSRPSGARGQAVPGYADETAYYLNGKLLASR